jgi:hypothetical protein
MSSIYEAISDLLFDGFNETAVMSRVEVSTALSMVLFDANLLLPFEVLE